jgi:hypothetical protein
MKGWQTTGSPIITNSADLASLLAVFLRERLNTHWVFVNACDQGETAVCPTSD